MDYGTSGELELLSDSGNKTRISSSCVTKDLEKKHQSQNVSNRGFRGLEEQTIIKV